MALTGTQEGKPNVVSKLKAQAYVTAVNISLAKTNHISQVQSQSVRKYTVLQPKGRANVYI